LESAAAPDEILPTLAETVGQTLRLPYVAVAIREGDSFPIAAEDKTVGTNEEVEAEVYPLVYQSELVGQLLVSPRASNEPFTPADRRLLENVARQAGAAVHAAQLTAKLQRSRQHLVAAREEERRRLRRDLHDGLGPQLATLSLKIDATRNHLEENIEAADHLLVELKSQVQDAIRDVRRLVYDLRPPALDQLGLVSALRQHAASHNGHQELRITIDAPAQLPPLPAAVEVAAYRIALEAMTNVTRHAGAQTCTIRLWIEDGLQLEVSDDGRGLPSPIDAGMGLISMQERAAELGGSFVVESGDIPEAGGTVVRVHLPLMDMEQDHE
jgi:two-component system NarL family sensor kinase